MGAKKFKPIPGSRLKPLLIAVSLLAVIEGFIIYKNHSSVTGSFTLPPYDFYSTDDYIRAYGSWISESAGGTITAGPVNTTELSCYQPRALCIEARASKMKDTGQIVAQRIDYKIKKWTPEEVVATYQDKNTTVELHLDRVRKVVTSIEIEKGTAEKPSKFPYYAHMEDGKKAIEKAKSMK